ncbi:hypothetical protein DD630_30675 [Streptomyces sp. BSE7F]|nr:hypothetical protein DD630_30675 [Streptomyces sp. BSE7F]
MEDALPTTTTAQHQVRTPPDKTLDTASAEVVLWRTAQIRAGHGPRARAATRALTESFNEQHEGVATALSYEDAFGTRGRLHWLVHLRSMSDYTALTQRGADRGAGFSVSRPARTTAGRSCSRRAACGRPSCCRTAGASSAPPPRP